MGRIKNLVWSQGWCISLACSARNRIVFPALLLKFGFINVLNMHSAPCTVNAALLTKSYSLKTADNPAPCWSAPILVSPHLLSLSNCVFLVCFHIPSLPLFLTLACMLPLLCSSSLYLPLSVSLSSVSLCTSAPLSSLPLLFSSSAAYCQFCQPLSFFLSEHL